MSVEFSREDFGKAILWHVEGLMDLVVKMKRDENYMSDCICIAVNASEMARVGVDMCGDPQLDQDYAEFLRKTDEVIRRFRENT